MLPPASFMARPVMMGVCSAVYCSTTVGMSGVAMLTARPLSVSEPLLPATSLTVAVMA